LVSFRRKATVPAPTRIAAPPNSNSRVSWSPAVPPPPAAGGPEGTRLARELVVAGGAVGGVVKTDEDGLVVLGLVVLGLVVLGLVVLGLVVLGLVLAGPVALAVLLAGAEAEPGIGGIDGPVVDVPPPVHADMAVEAKTVSAQAPISLALSVNPARVVRSLIDPPHAPYAGSFPGSGFTNPHRKK
jgi:hypothetical protein